MSLEALPEFGETVRKFRTEAQLLSEQLRLTKLKGLGILDTPAEAVFDDLVTLAAEITGTPTAMLTFIDETRAFIKSSFNGLAAGSSHDREHTFCTITVDHPDTIHLVRDATVDPILKTNPWVMSGFTRFYAGVPLVTADHLALGSLCVVDTLPRDLSPLQSDMMWRLSRIAMQLVETRRTSRRKQSTTTT